MLLFTIRKMLNNKWMLLCTLIGAITTVAIVCSVPIYSNAIMQRMIIKDLQNFQIEKGKYPGAFIANFEGALNRNDNIQRFDFYNNKITNSIKDSFGLPVKAQNVFVSHGASRIDDTSNVVDVAAISSMAKNIKLESGKLYSSNRNSDGSYEAIVSLQALQKLKLVIGNTYDVKELYKPLTVKNPYVQKVKITGVFSYKDANSVYWNEEISKHSNTFFIDYDLFMKEYIKESPAAINKARWYIAYDYTKINVQDITDYTDILSVIDDWFGSNSQSLKYSFNATDIINQFKERSKSLNQTLLILQVPILVILAFYTYMISKMKIEFESNEIAVIKSRGGSGLTILYIYIIESTVIGLISLLLGPFLGLFICEIIGSSNGFLEFVQRSALPVKLGTQAYLYALIAVGLIVCSMLIPAAKASRTSIVLYKQSKSRRSKSFWQKFYIDFVLLGVAVYGWFSYKRQQNLLFITGAKGTDVGMDSLLYVISVIFVFACGLLFLRIFPYVIKLVYLAGKNRWKPAFYSTLLSLSRSGSKEQFAMIFIIMTLSIGIYSASSARTINLNTEQQINYQQGCDMVVMQEWTTNKPQLPKYGPPTLEDRLKEAATLVYYEPNYSLFTSIKQIESVTKVLKIQKANVRTGSQTTQNVEFMGIKPNEFGKTATFETSLLPYHWYNYLNLLTDAPNAVIVSKAFKDKLSLKEGDTISINWENKKSMDFVVYAFVDYWPTLNPNRKVENALAPYFVVGNLDYVQVLNSVEPYQVWIKKKPDVTSNELYKAFEDRKITLTSISDCNEKLIKKKNDPWLQGTNGSMSLGFIVTILICIIGFLVYWIMSIKKRILQFGIFRALGLPLKSIIGMIALEQLLVTGAAILGGASIGTLASYVFVPMLQLVNSAEQQVPPFKVIFDMNDNFRLFVVFGTMLIICFLVLRKYIQQINVGQALKLGED